MSVYKDVSDETTPFLRLSYHCLGADTVGSVNPDVFGHNFAILREIEIFLQLHQETRSANIFMQRTGQEKTYGKLTFAVYETVVEVPAIFVSY